MVGSLEKRLRQVGNGPRLRTETACRKERVRHGGYSVGLPTGQQLRSWDSRSLPSRRAWVFSKMQHHRLGVLFCSAPVGPLWRRPSPAQEAEMGSHSSDLELA